jgi:hypothetical protein
MLAVAEGRLILLGQAALEVVGMALMIQWVERAVHPIPAGEAEEVLLHLQVAPAALAS